MFSCFDACGYALNVAEGKYDIDGNVAAEQPGPNVM